MSGLTSSSPSVGGYRDVVLADRPVSYWRLGEPSGTIAVDECGVHNLTYRFGGFYTLGEAGAIANDANTAMSVVDHNGSAYTGTPPSALKFANGACSFELWFKRKPTSSGSPDYLLFAWETAGVKPGIGINDGVDSKIRFFGNGDTWAVSVQAVPNTDNRWHHVVGVKRSGTGTGLSVYVDGVKGTDGFSTVPWVDSDAYHIGEYHGGYTDEVAIYNYALNEAQVAAHYAAGIRDRTGVSARHGVV